MMFFKKKYKFYPSRYGCDEPLALKVFLDEKGNLEKMLGGKIKATSIHHWNLDPGYVDYIVYTLEDSGRSDKHGHRHGQK